ncbi:MAG TPA: hypothetical protein VM870_05190 [Pyrinomonadaceae bacterium]|nr:hypothetical protein [Pyrinomonadaceae bacterium]
MSLHISPDTRMQAERNNLTANQLIQRLNSSGAPFTDLQLRFLYELVVNQQQICASILNIIADNQGQPRR